MGVINRNTLFDTRFLKVELPDRRLEEISKIPLISVYITSATIISSCSRYYMRFSIIGAMPWKPKDTKSFSNISQVYDVTKQQKYGSYVSNVRTSRLIWLP